MTPPSQHPQTQSPPPAPDRPRWRLPEPTTKFGALFYGVAASLIFSLVVYVVEHLHITIGWR
jgi:hypothetical protein